MDPNSRGRSPSANNASHLRHTPSASPHPPYNQSFVDTNLLSADHSFQNLHNSAPAGLTQGLQQPQPDYSLGQYNTFKEQQQPQQVPIVPSQNNDVSNHTFLQSSQVGDNLYGFNQAAQGNNHLSPGAIDHNISSGANSANSSFPTFDFNQLDQSNSLDPSLLDPSGIDLLQPQPAQLDNNLDPMAAAAMQSHTPTPPHLFPEATHRSSASPSPHASPNPQQGHFQSMNRPRNTSESLDPSSAAYPQGNGNEWASMSSYRPHQRSPSDQLSDISSAHNSPYMQTLDNLDINAHSSPMLNPSADPSFNDSLGLGQFSLNDGQHPGQSYYSPGHSPHISPRLMPQQSELPAFTAENNYGMAPAMSGQFMQPHDSGDMFPSLGQEPFPSYSNQPTSPSDLGAADQMSPPEISIDYAPPAKNNNIFPRPNSNNDDTLSPPLRNPSRHRMRAQSDSAAGSRPMTPSLSRGRSPSLQPPTSQGSLAPFDNNSASSRSSSPARGRNGSLSSRNRSSSNASDRGYILDLANPERTPSNGADKGRIQKHPATFQCTLCPKRFTRAYNLRSHLRTHTDERPFVCTVCGKAFARQHDRKRHEGLHSGEKKFVCRGTLQSSSQWGCGRRFARADALGRHFRSEAGRVCIKPLLDEEAAERRKAWMEEQQQAQVAAGLVAPQPMMAQPHIDMNLNNFLPAALLQQYPALAGLDWGAIPQGPPPDEEVYSGRSSFDASSGGELHEDLSENEMGAYPADQNMGGMGGHQNFGMQQQSTQGFGGNQAGDYLNGFEGR
ncbi:hypothetical protein WHR41_07046 [Cladosporium halotolerans]|uniref:C2H2-type domain-containing protein n=1 Tax=Cladosporium halotolerans TaxID=1052096 RepID=A0AB34KMI9_9PEZI